MRFLILILFPSLFFAQIGAKAYYILPNKELQKTVKPALAYQLLYATDFDEFWRGRFGISYCKYGLKGDSLDISYEEVVKNKLTTFYGKKLVNSYKTAQISSGVDFSFFNTDDLNLYASIDLNAGIVMQNSTNHYPGLDIQKENSTKLMVGMRIGPGVEVNIGKYLRVFSEIHRNFFIIADQGKYAQNEIGLGLRINFESGR